MTRLALTIDSDRFKTFQDSSYTTLSIPLIQHFRTRNFITVERAVLYERYATIEMKYSKIRD